MGNSVRLRALALVTAGILGSWSLGGTATADHKPDHADQGQHLGQTKDPAQGEDKGTGKDKGKGKGKGEGEESGKGDGPGKDSGKHAGHAHAPGQVANPGHQGGHGHGGTPGQGQGQAPGQAPGHAPGHAPGNPPGNPPGNNGTVKIAGPGDEIGHPSNNPHPGCTFLVEWFGFDEGADVASTVTFASQAPTSDVVLGGTAPAQVFVGGDPAGGGTDLDGRQAYTLTFQGEPHPKQGYHVKLTVATPHSLGNDTKSKVFWVEPCTTETEPETTAPGAEETPAAGVGSGTVDGEAGTTDEGVLGETFVAADEADEADETAVASDGAAVPTAVDAGESSALPEWARSPLPLTLVSLVLVLAGAAIVLRNRSRA